MKNLTCLIFLLWSGQSLGFDVSVKSEVTASESSKISGLDFFDRSTVPEGFAEALKNVSVDLDFSKKNFLKMSRQEFSTQLRSAVLSYNQNFKSQERKVRLLIPNFVKILSPEEPLTVAKIKERLRKQLQPLCAKCEFKIFVNSFEPPKVRGEKSWELQNLEQLWKGNVQLVLKAGKSESPLSVNVRWFQEILIAKKNIFVGAKINSKSLSKEKRDVTFLVVDFMTKTKNASGMQATKNIRKGQPLEAASLTQPNIVEFGRVLRAIVSKETFALSVPAKAKGSGAAGDIIPIELLSSKKKVMARIINQEKVEIQ